MRGKSVPRKYAEALFLLAEKSAAVEAVRSDVESIVELLRRAPALLSFLESPDVAQEEKLKLLEQNLRGRVREETWVFLLLLLRRKIILLLPDIFSAYVAMDEKKRGIQRIRVVSAVTLEREEKELLVVKLQRITGKKILMDAVVDPSIIGGVVVYVDGRVIDGSVRTRLEELREQLMSASVC